MTEVPSRQGNRGRHPTITAESCLSSFKARLVSGAPQPVEVRAFAQSMAESDWTQLSVRKTERGWLIADFAAVRVWHSVDNLPFQEVWLVMRRPIGSNSPIRYSFSNKREGTPLPVNAPREESDALSHFSDTPLLRLAKMQCRRYWVERALEDAKGEAGLDQY